MRSFHVTLLSLLLSVSCIAQDTLQVFDHGHLEGDKYVNAFFDLQLELPKDWVVQSQEQVDLIMKTGREMVAGDDANLKAVVKASEVNTAQLITAFQYELGTAVDYNPGFMLIAENLVMAPGIKNGHDYLFHARRLMQSIQIQYDHLDEEFDHQVINNIDFYTLNASFSMNGMQIKQVYYATTKNGFSVVGIISFINDDQRELLLKVINSIKSI